MPLIDKRTEKIQLPTYQPTLVKAGTQNALVIGVIINSSNTKTFDATHTQYNSGERSVWTFTLRDSEEDFINVTVWGSTEFVKKMSFVFHIGNVVEVINPKVVLRRTQDKNEMFVPTASVPYSLTVNEGSGLVQIHDAPTREDYERLVTMPAKSAKGLKTLAIILRNMEALSDQYVDILVVVTFISEARNIITRDGRSLKCRSFEVADGSTDETVSLVLWEKEWIERSAFWEPKRTVLFLADARVAYDNFRKKLGLSMADTITTVMTIQEISQKLNKKTRVDERLQFAVIVKATVTDINVDSIAGDLISRRCALCKKVVGNDQDSCMNLECPSGNGSRAPYNSISFNIKVNLKDETGYLIGCRLTGETAERVIGCTTAEFQTMTIPQRADLKWKYLLEACDVRLHVLGPTSAFPRALYNILSMNRIQDDDEENMDDTGTMSDY
ncbi:hypothetical protein KM043_008842 [Ampulex compressa]|nr:hypothetical protein KM043_008842 [Ampulex compressa]